MMRRAVLISEREVHLGSTNVPASCAVIKYTGAYFVRTGETVRLRASHRAFADVFQETEIFNRGRLDPP